MTIGHARFHTNSGPRVSAWVAATWPFSVRYEHARLQLRLGVGVEVPQGLHSRPDIGRQPFDARAVELDEVAGRIADVELDDVARQLDEPVVEGLVVEGAATFRGPVDGLEIIDGDGEVMVAGGRRSRSNRCSWVRPSASHWTGSPKLGVAIGWAPSRSK